MSAEPRFLVLQHIACEPPAAYEDELEARSLELVRVQLDEGDRLPRWREFDAIVAMGGPMGAGDERDHAWLGPEKALIREAVDAGLPYWGVCLGAQLLAASLGARVYSGPRPEVGVPDVELTAEGERDPVFSALPPRFPALQWHGDTWELPAGAVRLARSSAYEEQAFVYRRAYALQFHLEVSPSLAREWGDVPTYAASLEGILGEGALAALVGEVTAHATETLPLARRLFARWLDEVVAA